MRYEGPSKITLEIADYLNQQLEDDDELSSVELQHLVAQLLLLVRRTNMQNEQRYRCLRSTFLQEQ